MDVVHIFSLIRTLLRKRLHILLSSAHDSQLVKWLMFWSELTNKVYLRYVKDIWGLLA